MPNNQLLPPEKRILSTDACYKFLDDLIETPIFKEVKPTNYQNDDWHFILSEPAKPPLYTYIQLVYDDGNIDKFYAPIEFYVANFRGLTIHIPDSRIREISGFMSFNSNYIFIEFNDLYHTLEFDIIIDSQILKIIIFPHISQNNLLFIDWLAHNIPANYIKLYIYLSLTHNYFPSLVFSFLVDSSCDFFFL